MASRGGDERIPQGLLQAEATGAGVQEEGKRWGGEDIVVTRVFNTRDTLYSKLWVTMDLFAYFGYFKQFSNASEYEVAHRTIICLHNIF